MKVDRLVSIIMILLDKKRIGAQELADMFEVSPRTIYRDIDAINMAGIPVRCVRFFGLVVVVPLIREFGRTLKSLGLVDRAGDGNSILTTSLILGMMILPTIIGTTESAMRAVPAHYYEALSLWERQRREVSSGSSSRRQNQV